MIEWKAVREATSRFLPQHAAAAAWKHRNMSHVLGKMDWRQCPKIVEQNK